MDDNDAFIKIYAQAMGIEQKKHCYRVGGSEEGFDEIPPEESVDEFDEFCSRHRKKIEPWLSAMFQSEHLNLLLGSGFTTAVAKIAGAEAAGMDATPLKVDYSGKIDEHARRTAERMGRGKFNAEDQIRSALALLEGLEIAAQTEKHEQLKNALNERLKGFLESVLQTESDIEAASPEAWGKAVSFLQSFLLSFASRSASRERLHVFTTNYDRLVERGCDLAGLRIVDRFVGALEPIFRASRLDVDFHYNPPGIRGEPRFMEGVLRLTKLHGSLDWLHDPRTGRIVRRGVPFGPAVGHPFVPNDPVDTVMIYPNAAKDIETTAYPYVELFRDMASALCRPNSVLVIYGYGFGDDHVNRIILDMLTIPSTHLVVISYACDDRLSGFLSKAGRPAQISILIGSHFARLEHLVERYLPKPAIDHVTNRMAELMKNRAPLRDNEERKEEPKDSSTADRRD